MKLKSETKQLIKFLRFSRIDTMNESVSNICYDIKLNDDMVMKTLVLLNKAGIISRKGIGPTSRYILPKEIGLGDIIKTVEGIDCEDISVELVDYLNTIKV